MKVLLLLPMPPAAAPDHGGAVRRLQAVKALAELTDLEIFSLVPPLWKTNIFKPENAKIRLFDAAVTTCRVLPGSFRLHPGLNRLNKAVHFMRSVTGSVPAAAAARENRRLAASVHIRSAKMDLTVVDHLWMAGYLPFIQGRRALLSYGDEAGLLKKRLARSHMIEKPVLKHELIRCKSFYKRAIAESDLWLCVESTEREMLVKSGVNAHVLPVWSESQMAKPRSAPVNGGRLIFVGPDHWPPNRTAIELLIKKIWPYIVRRVNTARLVIVGNSRVPGNGSVWSRSGCDDITSLVSFRHVSSLDGFLRNSDIFIAPIPWGHGVKVKMLTAAGYGLPLIGTREAFRGLKARNGYHGIISQNWESLARETVRVLNSPELYTRLSAGALNLAEKYSKPEIISAWKRVLSCINA